MHSFFSNTYRPQTMVVPTKTWILKYLKKYILGSWHLRLLGNTVSVWWSLAFLARSSPPHHAGPAPPHTSQFPFPLASNDHPVHLDMGITHQSQNASKISYIWTFMLTNFVQLFTTKKSDSFLCKSCTIHCWPLKGRRNIWKIFYIQ